MTVTGRVGQQFVLCAGDVSSDDFTQTSVVAEISHLHTLTLTKNAGVLSINNGEACPEWLTSQYPYDMAQQILSTEPFIATRKKEPRSNYRNEERQLSALPSNPFEPKDNALVTLTGGGSGFDDHEDFKRPPFMPVPDKAIANLILLPTLNIPANWRDYLSFAGLYNWLTDQSEEQPGLTLLVRFDGQPPITLRVSQAEYPEMAGHLLNARQLLRWLAPKLNGREAFIQQLMDMADAIGDTLPLWDVDTLSEVQRQLMIVLEQPDTEFSLEFEKHWLYQSLSAAMSNRGQVKCPETPEPDSKAALSKSGDSTESSKPENNESDQKNPDQRQKVDKQEELTLSQPPEDEVIHEQVDDGEFFTIKVGGKIFLIDKRQLDPKKRGREDPETIKAFTEASPDQSYPLTRLEQQVFQEREKDKAWLADDNMRTTLDYLCVYGSTTTKEALWRYYPVYSMAMPESAKYYPPSPFYADAEHDQNCSICLEYFFQQGEAVKTPCRHLYCAHCLKNLMVFQSACPTCRHPIQLPDSMLMEMQFSEAVTAADLHGLGLLLGLGVDINQQDADGNAALHLAYHHQHKEVTDFLLNKGADKDQKNKAGQRPIDLAPLSEKESLVELEEFIEQQLTLFEQVAQGKIRQLKTYLGEGGDPNQQEPESGSSLLYIAVANDQYDLVNLLLQQPAIKVDESNKLANTPLMEAAKKGNEAIAVRLLEQGASQLLVNKDGMNPLMLAAQSGHVPLVNLLLDHPTQQGEGFEALKQSDMNKRTALILAVQKQHYEMAKLLLDKGADIHHQDDYCINALMHAAHTGHLRLTKLLSRRGANTDDKGGEGIETEDEHGRTALEIAANDGLVEVVKCLLEVGAEFRESLEIASSNGYVELIKELVKQGADVNDSRLKPLCAAANMGHLEAVQLLIDLGADVNPENAILTPLHCACLKGHLKVVKALIKNGADASRACYTRDKTLPGCLLKRRERLISR